MVEKVDLINAPQKFTVQQPNVEQVKPKEVDENKKVDWKTIGLAGAALTAAVIGGIYYLKSGKNPKNAIEQGQKLGEDISKNINPRIDETDGKIIEEVKLSPFDLDSYESVTRFLGKGKKITKINYPLKQNIEFDHYYKIDDKTDLYYDDKTVNFKVNGDDIKYLSYTPKNNYEKTKNVNEYTNIIECESGHSNNLRIFQNEKIADIMFGTSSNTLPIKIRYEKCSGKPIFIEYDNVRIDNKFANEFVKDFNINKYLSNNTYRASINQRFIDNESMLKFASKNKMTYDDIIELKSSDEFQAIIKQGQEVADYVESPACKNIFETLDRVFGLGYKISEWQFDLSKVCNESDLFKLLRLDPASGYRINTNAIIEYTDDANNFIKDKNGITFRLQYLKVQGKTLTQTPLNDKIETTLDGRYIRFFDDWMHEYKIYNPEKITNDNPKITSAFSRSTSVSLKEYPDKKVYELKPDRSSNPIKITIDNDGMINFDETYIKTRDEQKNTESINRFQPQNEEQIKEFLDIVDFSKISESDWQQTFKEMANELLSLPRSVTRVD